MTLAGLFNGGGSINVPDPNPPVPVPEDQQTVPLAVVTTSQTVFPLTVTRSSSTQNLTLPLVTTTPTLFPPAVSTLTFPINEPFTGSGTPGPLWGASNNSTGATTVLSADQLVMTSGTLGSYLDFNYLPMNTSITAGNIEMTVDVTIGTPVAEDFISIGFRGSGIQEPTVEYRDKQTQGYFVEIAPSLNIWGLFRRGNVTSTTLHQVQTTWVAGDVAHIRIQAAGSNIKVWLWRNAGTQTVDPQINLNDSTYSTGKFWLGRTAGAAQVLKTCRFDNWTAALIAPPPPPPPPSGGETFAQYKQSILDEMIGFGYYGNVTGGLAATTPTVVTTTANAGAGSLREALTTGSTRWIVFDPDVFPPDVEKFINLTSLIPMRNANSNITLDGCESLVTITGFGISTATYVGAPAGVNNIANNLIFINIKIANVALGGGFDCITLDGTDRAWLYHLDLSGGGDGNLDITNIHAGPNSVGYMTIQNCYIHDSKTGKGCLISDQTTNQGDYIQPSSSYPNGTGGANPRRGGDNNITIVDSRFKDSLRNPVISNYWVHMFNTYHHGWTLEGPSAWGLNGHLRMHDFVADGTGAGSNASKGVYAQTFHYPDSSRDYKYWLIGPNYNLRGGATVLDASGGFLNPPIGSIFTIPYSFDAETVSNNTQGDALIARLTSTNLETQGRAGVVKRAGYWSRVANPPAGGGRIWNVPAEGSLQAVADQAVGGDTIYVTGTVTASGKILDLKNRNNGTEVITVIGNPGNLLRGGTSGIEGYGSCRGWHFQNLNVQVDGGAFFGEGFYFGGMRTDQGGDGLGAANIRIIGCTVRPIPGTGVGRVQRNGIAVWGCDVVEVGNCDVSDVAYNDLGFPGGAGSGISIGISIGNTSYASWANGTRIWIHDNKVRNCIGPGSGSYDRNTCIADLLHGAPGSPLYANRSVGPVLIDNNDFADCEGRAVQLLVAGTADSPVTVSNNLVRGFVATNLAGSEPIAAIGGYGDGRCGNVIINTNDVSITGGAAAYKFISFDAGMDASIIGVRGSGNVGSPVVFDNSATDSPPAGFT